MSKLDVPETTGHVPIGDIVFENAVLFLHDVLLTCEFSDTIKARESAHIIPVLKLWTYAYEEHGHSKYAFEMVLFVHNLVNVWPPEFRSIFIISTQLMHKA